MAYESIRQGLTEAIGHAKGERKVVKVGRPAPDARRPLTWRPCEA